jgi:hypothetical protein
MLFLAVFLFVFGVGDAALVIDEAPRTRAALTTLFFKPYEASPTYREIRGRALELALTYGDRQDGGDARNKLADAVDFLHLKHHAVHPCQKYWDKESNVYKGPKNTLGLAFIPMPGRLCKRFINNGNVYDGTYDVPLPSQPGYSDKCHSDLHFFCVDDEDPDHDNHHHTEL